MDNFFINTILLSVIAYCLAMLVSRILGRKLISQMTFFDFVVGVSMGSIIANVVLAYSSPLAAIMALLIFAVLTLLTEFMYIKSIRIRKLVNSKPVVLIDRGQIIDRNMKKVRLTINDLLMLLREKNHFNIGDIEYAVMEITGKLSVLPKAAKQLPTVSDLNLNTDYKGLTRDLVMDGSILQENLRGANIKETDFLNRLQSYGITQVGEVFYAGLDSAGNLYVSKKQTRLEYNGQYGID